MNVIAVDHISRTYQFCFSYEDEGYKDNVWVCMENVRHIDDVISFIFDSCNYFVFFKNPYTTIIDIDNGVMAEINLKDKEENFIEDLEEYLDLDDERAMALILFIKTILLPSLKDGDHFV